MAKIDIELPGGQKAGQTLQELSKEANKLWKEISKLPEGSKEFVEKSKKFQEVSNNVAQVKTQIKGTTDASNQLKDSFNHLVPFSGQLSSIGQQFGSVKKGVGGLISSMGTLRGAIISTGIGALVVILGSLISYFTTTQEGIDKVTAVTRPLSAVMERLKGILQELGQKVFKQISEAIDNPKQALIDLGNVIVQNVINRFKALALFGPALKKLFSKDWKEGLKDLGNAVIQVSTGVENAIDKITNAAKEIGKVIDEAYKKGQRIDELQKQIERAEIKQIVRSKELELLIKKQKSIVEDTTRSYDERRAASERALQAQEALLNGELSLIDKRIEKMKLEQTLNDTDRAGEKEMAELVAKRLELQARSTDQQLEFKKKINELNKLEAAEEAKISAMRLELVQGRLDHEIEIITQNSIAKLSLITGTEKEIAAQTLAIQRETEEEIRRVQEEALQLEIEKIQLDTETKIGTLQGSAEQIAAEKVLLQELEEQQIQAVKDRYATEAAQKDFKFKEEEKKRARELAEEQKRIAQEKAEFEAQMMEVQRDMLSDSFGFATELSAKQVKDEATAKKVRKVGGLVEIGINLQREMAANAAAAAANPLNATTFGAAGAAQLAGTNLRSLIRAGIGAAKIIAFRKGGVLRGPSHEEGGIDFTVNGNPGFNAEGDEILLTRGVYRNPTLRRAASIINVLGGGRKFAAGGPINPYASDAVSGGSISRSSADASTKSLLGMDEIKTLLRENLQAINNRFDTLKVINVASETQAVNDSVTKIKNEADV